MKRHRSGIAGLAVLAAVAALPVVVTAYRRGRGNYTGSAHRGVGLAAIDRGGSPESPGGTWRAA